VAETWRLLHTPDLAPALNMGLDEVLALESSEPTPVLRLYTWEPATLSLGYFQRFDAVPAALEAARVVRRITGGGAIHHAEELTFSIGAPLEHPLFAGPVGPSYERIHGIIARALAELGIEAALRGEQSPIASDREGTGMCFHDSTPLDLCWGDRKGVGSAQRRTGGRVLHHGSLKVGKDPLEPGVASLVEVGASVAQVGDLLVRTLAAELGIALEKGEPTPLELERAGEAGQRYGDPDFVRRR